jgi:nucleotide-binding universal stress UspA family protein
MGHADLTGAGVRAVLAWQYPLLSGVDPLTAHVDWPANAQQTLDAALEKTVDVYTADVSSAAVEGHPAQVLLDASVGAQLLVFGNSGHGAFSEMLPGSVREHIITHATCPVLVMSHHCLSPNASSR